MPGLTWIKRNIKEVLLVWCLLLAAQGQVERLLAIQGAFAKIVYLGLLAFLTACLVATAYIQRAAVRWGTAALLALSAYSILVFENTTAEFLTYDAFINMLHSAGFAGDAVSQHAGVFIRSVIEPLLLFFAIGLRPQRYAGFPQWVPVLAPYAGVIALSILLFGRGGDGARGQPLSFTPLSYLTLAGYEALIHEAGPRQEVAITPVEAPAARDIVFIIDESISGQYLDINSPGGVETPLSRAHQGVNIYNYGLATSVNNCSVGTNVTLRFGGTRDDYRRINATMPSIWQYAQKAGLKTVYIDAQRTHGALHNLMDDAERAHIDAFVQFDDSHVQMRDILSARKIVDYLKNDTAELLVVNKVGGHFPVHDKYPDDFMLYRPTLPRGGWDEVADTGDRTGFDGTEDDWVRYRNSYRNTLAWNIGAFFQELLDSGQLGNATIVYTADHGQDLHERGSPGNNTHCSVDPGPEEGVVPLVVIEGANVRKPLGWSAHLAGNVNRSSHFMIFPSLLRLMGYSAEQISETYGASLLEPSTDPQTINILFHARLGRHPIWRAIDVTTVMPPPAGDSASGGGIRSSAN